jgi:hypothetical protein
MAFFIVAAVKTSNPKILGWLAMILQCPEEMNPSGRRLMHVGF